MVKKFFSHYAPRPLQQPQMPDMKQIKHSVCNHIRHFSLLSHLPSAGNPSTQLPHCITQHHNHHHSTNHATQSKLTLPRRQHIEKLRVEELGVGKLAGAGAFQDALRQIPQFTSLFCQRLSPFITATQPSKNLEPVAALVRLFHCYCNFMNKVITALLTHPLRPQLTHVLHVLNG